jgi:hypothetical protein
VLRRIAGASELRRIAKLTGRTQQDELRELLACDIYDDPNGEGFADLALFYERRLRTALLSLAGDPHTADNARRALASIGVPEDIRWLVHHAPAPSHKRLGDFWAVSIASALVEPADEAEWAFLRKCALNEFNNGFVVSAAEITLGLIGTPRSAEILEQARRYEKSRAWIHVRVPERTRPNPPPLADRDLEKAVWNVEQALKALGMGTWKTLGSPRYNEDGDMALVHGELVMHRSGVPCKTTFHKVDGVWKLRGVMTAQTGASYGRKVPPPTKSR